MATDLADPTGRDKGLGGVFVVVSFVAHAFFLVTFAALGGRGGAKAEAAPPPAATSPPAVEVLEDQDDPQAVSDVAVDELAGKAGAAPPPPAEPSEPAIELPPLPATAPRLPPPPRAPASARPKPQPSASPAASGSAEATPAASASAGPGGDGPGSSPDDGAGHARKAPDVAARFNKELPTYASPVEGWAELGDGDAGAVTFTLALDERGKVIADSLVITKTKPAPPAPLVESVRRTLLALRMTLALPDHSVRAGRLTLTVRANVKRGAPRPDIQKFRIASEYEKKKGRGEFELESGLLVTFALEVVAVEVDGGAPN